MFTFSLLYLFKFSNFVVGTSLSKTEVIQVAIFEYIVLNDKLNAAGVIGIIIATTGVIIMTIKDINFFIKNLFSKTTLVGLITGLFLVLYAFFRFVIEYIREPDLHLGLFFNFISMGQILSIPLFILGIILLRKN